MWNMMVILKLFEVVECGVLSVECGVFIELVAIFAIQS